ncbi:MAG: branched-chain amino acid ABC transporter permease [Christensenellaceae bacterium]|nr:branched-chain amino acid ABC transporter permease [Christensenellaceae bacterium]
MIYNLTLLLNGITYAGLLFVVASGLTLVFGLMRMVNMAHGSMYILGASVGWLLYKISNHNWVLALLGAGVVMMLVAFLLQLALYNKAYGNPILGIMISIGVSWIFTDLSIELTRGEAKAFSPEGIVGSTFQLGELTYPYSRLIVLVVAIAELILILIILKKTKVGQIIRAGVDDRDMVSSLGINIELIFLGVFAFSGFLVGLAGVLGGTMVSFSTDGAGSMQMLALMVIIVGGRGSIEGAALAALMIGLLDSFTSAYVPNISTIIVFSFVMAVLVLKPQGLFVKEVRKQ